MAACDRDLMGLSGQEVVWLFQKIWETTTPEVVQDGKVKIWRGEILGMPLVFEKHIVKERDISRRYRMAHGRWIVRWVTSTNEPRRTRNYDLQDYYTVAVPTDTKQGWAIRNAFGFELWGDTEEFRRDAALLKMAVADGPR